MNRPFLLSALSLLAAGLTGCIGDLPQEDFPCLVENDLYNKYNEAYVFSPQGQKKRDAKVIVENVEAECLKGVLPEGTGQ